MLYIKYGKLLGTILKYQLCQLLSSYKANQYFGKYVKSVKFITT